MSNQGIELEVHAISLRSILFFYQPKYFSLKIVDVFFILNMQGTKSRIHMSLLVLSNFCRVLIQNCDVGLLNTIAFYLHSKLCHHRTQNESRRHRGVCFLERLFSFLIKGMDEWVGTLFYVQILSLILGLNNFSNRSLSNLGMQSKFSKKYPF